MLYQARIQLKEESIQKLQDLLKAAHDDMEKMNHKHFEELQEMQLKIQANTDKSFHNFKEAARELVNKTNSDSDLTQQVQLFIINSYFKLIFKIFFLYTIKIYLFY